MAGKRILIVEDEGILATGLQDLLEERGFEVVGLAATGRDAIAIAADSSPDLILMDIRLTGDMDGVEAARFIRERSDAAVLYLTAYADEATLSRALGTSPFAYVVKPYEERELMAAIRTALQRHEDERQIRLAMARVEEAKADVDHQKRFFETLFAALPCGVLVVDRDKKVSAVNPALEATLGIVKEDALGKPMGEVLGCSELPQLRSNPEKPGCWGECVVHHAIQEAFEGKTVQRRKAEMRLSRWGEARQLDLLVSTAGVRFEGKDLCVVILEDFTELGNLRRLLQTHQPVEGIVGRDPKILELFNTIREVADSKVPVLIQGQSGTGKELVAHAIHNQGPHPDRPFVTVNCGALPEGLLESELFGHVRGAFTGAIRDKKGRFELANGGTLFLDEVGELSPHTQVKLLRVLQNGAFERVGGEETIRVEVRILCATHQDLTRAVASGRFREDLFYRLAVVPVTVPPLCERRGDIPLLAAHFLEEIAKEHGKEGGSEISPGALALLVDHPWSGNVRELKNALQFAYIKARGDSIGAEHLPQSLMGTPRRVHRNDLVWKARLDEGKVLEALHQCDGNKLKAAKLLHVSRSTLYRFIEERFGKAEELP
jgi:DNA-binding NtrC family response regulator